MNRLNSDGSLADREDNYPNLDRKRNGKVHNDLNKSHNDSANNNNDIDRRSSDDRIMGSGEDLTTTNNNNNNIMKNPNSISININQVDD